MTIVYHTNITSQINRIENYIIDKYYKLECTRILKETAQIKILLSKIKYILRSQSRIGLQRKLETTNKTNTC